MTKPRKLAVTPGDPAGIGLDLVVDLALSSMVDKVVIIADRAQLEKRAEELGRALVLPTYNPGNADSGIEILHITCPFAVQAGQGDQRHTTYLLNTLDRAIDGCLRGEFDALVTGPVNKAMMSSSGIQFMGHTEYLAQKTGSDCPVMVLVSKMMKVALVTTHVPLNQVAAHITTEKIISVVRVLHHDCIRRFAIESPRIGVCGLNPHAGEGGKLGNEEVQAIHPAIQQLATENIAVSGPYPADTLFARHRLVQFDVVLTMYHDQGLPVIKHGAFGEIVNVTLGLPIIRTSVDHGTAYDIAGCGTADAGSLLQAVTLASAMSSRTPS